MAEAATINHHQDQSNLMLDPVQIRSILKQVKDQPIPRQIDTVDRLRHSHKSPHGSTEKAIEILQSDPGYTLGLFSFTNRELSRLRRQTATTLEHLILVLGMPKVINLGEELPVFTELDEQRQQLYKQNFSLCHHAAVQARELTQLRGSRAIDSAFFSAQMRELYLANLQRYVPETLEGRDALNFGVPDKRDGVQHLGQQLAKAWYLPTLTQESYAQSPSIPAYIIQFASRVCHLAEMGWYHPLMQQTFDQAAEVLKMDQAALIKCVHRSAIIAVRESAVLQVPHPAARLLETIQPGAKQIPATMPLPPLKSESTPKATEETQITSKPPTRQKQSKIAVELENSAPIKHLKEMGMKRRPAAEILQFSLSQIIQQFSDHAVVFFLLDKKNHTLRSRFVSSMTDAKHPITISLEQKSLFKLLLTKQQSAFIHDKNRDKYRHVLPVDCPLNIHNRNFLMMSLIVQDKPFGLFYVEAKTGSDIPVRDYQHFVTLCRATTDALEKVKRNAKTPTTKSA